MPDRTTTLPSPSAVCDELLSGPVPRVAGVRNTTRGWALAHEPSLRSIDDLLGRCLPRGWWGVALATTGRARRDDDPSRGTWPVRTALVAGRDGTITSAVLGPDGVMRSDPGDTPPVGLVVDLARRALGVATEPAVGRPLEHVIASWGAEVLDAAITTANFDLVDDAAAIEQLWPVPGFAPGDAPDSWAALHEVLVDATAGWGRLTAAQVAWFDAGSFARFVQAHDPNLTAVLEAVRHLRATVRQRTVLPAVNLVAGSVRAEPGEVG